MTNYKSGFKLFIKYKFVRSIVCLYIKRQVNKFINKIKKIMSSKFISFEASKKWWLNLNDFSKGLILAVLTAIITAISQVIDGDTAFSIIKILQAGGIAGFAYLTKNFITDDNDTIVKKKNKKKDK